MHTALKSSRLLGVLDTVTIVRGSKGSTSVARSVCIHHVYGCASLAPQSPASLTQSSRVTRRAMCQRLSRAPEHRHEWSIQDQKKSYTRHHQISTHMEPISRAASGTYGRNVLLFLHSLLFSSAWTSASSSFDTVFCGHSMTSPSVFESEGLGMTWKWTWSTNLCVCVSPRRNVRSSSVGRTEPLENVALSYLMRDPSVVLDPHHRVRKGADARRRGHRTVPAGCCSPHSLGR